MSERLRTDYSELVKHASTQIAELERVFGRIRELVAYYVTPDGQNLNPADLPEDDTGFVSRENVFKMLDKFLGGDPRFSHALVLSDAGMGKTSLLLTTYLAYLDHLVKSQFKVIILKLGRSSEQQITDIASREDTILLLDALDEDPEAWAGLYTRLQQLLLLTKHFRKVIITCRTQFIPQQHEKDGQNPGVVVLHGFPCSKVFMSPFDDDQVDEYLNRRFTEKTAKDKAQNIVRKMRSLKFRPMLLSYVDLLLDREETYESAYDLYAALVDEWLNRELRKGVIKDKVPLYEVCTALAQYLFDEKLRVIEPLKLTEIADSIPDTRSLEAMSVEGRSLLHRTSDGCYKFAHQSMLEYFVARSLLKKPRPIRTSDQIQEFILDNLQFHQHRKIADLDLGGIAINGLNLPGLDARRSLLVNAGMSMSDLSNSVFNGAILRGAKFNACKLDKANFSAAELQGVTFRECSLRGALLSGQVLNQVTLSECDLAGIQLDGTKFDGSTIADTRIKKTSLTGVSFEGSTIVDSAFDNSEFEQCHFRGGKLSKVSFADCKLSCITFDTVDGTLANFARADFKDCRVNSMLLSSARFFNARLERHDLTGVIAPHADFEQANVGGTVFSKASLSGASFRKAQCNDCVFAGAVMDGVTFSESSLVGADLTHAKAQGANFSAADLRRAVGREGQFGTSSFRNANLANANFQYANMESTDFTSADISGTDFSFADLSRTDLTGQDLTVCVMGTVNLSRAKLHKCIIRDLTGLQMVGASLRSAELGGARGQKCSFREVDFSNANMENSRFSGSNFDGAKLADANLRNSWLDDAILTNVDLRGADLSDARVTGAAFAWAIIDDRTKLPTELSKEQRDNLMTSAEAARRKAEARAEAALRGAEEGEGGPKGKSSASH
ncbi:MAG TPA: pentapeptide repeat-containing protein [Tepidisphaeraceae bacterium]|nr:pentapeptide repeat-containing protein [Tepidisphaeraceae bacterium]